MSRSIASKSTALNNLSAGVRSCFLQQGQKVLWMRAVAVDVTDVFKELVNERIVGKDRVTEEVVN